MRSIDEEWLEQVRLLKKSVELEARRKAIVDVVAFLQDVKGESGYEHGQEFRGNLEIIISSIERCFLQ